MGKELVAVIVFFYSVVDFFYSTIGFFNSGFFCSNLFVTLLLGTFLSKFVAGSGFDFNFASCAFGLSSTIALSVSYS